jgi:hypothetical protein
MPTPFESATLILTLYEQRREETMRKARDFFVTFDPRTAEEFMAGMFGPQGGYVRMVVSYWEQAASLVANGAIDEKMFRDANGEYILVFARIEPFLPQLREAFGNPGFAAHLEKLTLSLPDARARIDGTVARIRAMLAARAAAGN